MIDDARVGVVEMLDMVGRTVWTFALTAWKGNQPPVCGTDGRVYVADEGWLKCIKDGAPEWLAEFEPAGNFWLTSTADGRVIALANKHLMLFGDDGSVMFDVEITGEAEEFYAPPAIDRAGRIFVAGNKNLYCFE